MEADGRIVIDTAIDTDGFTAGSKDIEAAAKRTASKLDSIVKQAKANMQEALSSGAPTNLDDALKQTSAALDEATNKLQNFVEIGGTSEAPAFKWMMQDIENLKAKMAQLQAQKDAMNASDASMGGGGTEQNTYRLGNAFAALRARIAEYVRESKTAQSVQLLFSRSMGAIDGAVDGLRGKLQQAVASIKNYISHTQKVKKSSSIGAKGMAMLGLGVSSLLGALSQLRQGMVEGLQNLSKFDKGTNASLSSMKSSLSQVKNSLATAFSPILTAIAPAINTLLGLISKALNAIGEFVAALTGQNTFTRATTVQENFAESLGGTASAAKEAQKQMSGLDEMTTWQSKSSGGGGGGGGGGSGAGAFETVDITNSPIANFANQIKDMIAKQDFRGVGDLVAQKMNAAIGAWDGAGAGKKLSDGIKSALDTAIGFLQGTDWQNMGRQVANFITAIDWSGITNRLFEGLGSVLGGIAGFIWGLISDAWANVVTWWRDVAMEDGQFTMEGLLNGIWEGIKNIGKWIYDNIFQPFVDGFCKAFGIHSPSTVLYDLGLNIVQGLINAVKSIPQKAKQIFESARNSIKTVLNSISSFLGTTFKTDWSKKLGALGDPLNALLTNIKNVWNGIKTTFNGIITFVKGVFTGDWKKAWTGVKTAFSGVFTTLKSVAKAPLNSIVGLINGLITALNSMIRGLNKIKVNIPSWVPGLGGKSIGFNIPQISKVPYLATGAVIPPNAPFTAVLGDQRHGTNLEAPESLIRQIVREESGRGGGSWTFTAQINRRTLFREMIEEAKLQQARTGKDPFALA